MHWFFSNTFAKVCIELYEKRWAADLGGVLLLPLRRQSFPVLSFLTQLAKLALANPLQVLQRLRPVNPPPFVALLV